MFEQALTIAENEIVLIRVRAERVAAIERELDIPPESIARRDELAAMRRAIPALERLARYERRAWSARERAIHQFIEIRSGSHHWESDIPQSQIELIRSNNLNRNFGRTNPICSFPGTGDCMSIDREL